MRPIATLFALITTLGLVACDDSDAPLAGPVGEDQPRAVDPLPGGGISGDPLDGVLTVFVVDAEGLPIGGAWILAGGVLAQAGPDGRLDLEAAPLTGSVDVHVFASGHAHQSFLGVEGSVLTSSLEPEQAPVDPRARGVATVSGEVDGWHRLPAASSGQTRVVEIEAFGAGPLEALDQLPRPGSATLDDPDGMPMNFAIDGPPPFATWRTFALRADTRAVGLVAYGSTFDPDRSPELVTSHIGIRTGLDLADGEEAAGVDVSLTHELDEWVTIDGPASTLPRRLARFGLDLGRGAVVPLGASALNGQHRARARGPRLDGVFAEATYLVRVELESSERIEGRPAREAVGARSGTRLGFDLADMISTPPAPALADRTLAAPGPDGAELMRVRLIDSSGRLRWEIWSFEAEVRSTVLPEPPEGVPDVLAEAGSLEVESSAFDLGPNAPKRWSFADTRPLSEAHHRVLVDR